MKKIIILGAGAIGSAIGAILSKNSDVRLIGRKPHMDRIKETGLRVTGNLELTCFLNASLSIKQIEPDTLIILTTKAFDTQDSLTKIQHLIREDTTILCLQNGHAVERIAKMIVNCKVLRGITTLSANILQPGRIEINSMGITLIEKDEEIHKLFTDSALDCLISENIQQDVWNKLVINCILNPLTGLLNMRNKEIDNDELRPIIHEIIEECCTLAEKEHIDSDIIRKFVIENFPYNNNISSTLYDLQNNKRTEIDFLNGAVVKLAKKHNIDVPINQTLYLLIKVKEKKQ